MAAHSDQSVVLIVDDNPLIANVVSSLLSAQHYTVHVSENGHEAAEFLEKSSVDLIICDVMMPKMDGYEFQKFVRGRGELSHIPFLFLTALDDSEEIMQGLASGADSYLTKPFNPRELIALVRGKLERARAQRAQVSAEYDGFRKQVIHTLSHELRTPLVAINTGAELLIEQHDNLDKKSLTRLLEAIHRGGARLERLVTDFMLLQQIEAGVAQRTFEARAGVHTLATIVQQTLQLEQSTLERDGFVLSFDDQSKAARVFVYDVNIIDIVQRLLSNAVKFSRDVKSIEIVVSSNSESACFEVRDRGLGVDPAKLDEALALFGQLDRGRLEQQGSGLGLAIASRYAKINGATLELKNRDGGGTVARFVAPRRTEAA